jgi:hypothetical protein
MKFDEVEAALAGLVLSITDWGHFSAAATSTCRRPRSSRI